MDSMIHVSQLPSYDWLSLPMWVFDQRLLRITWANGAGLVFWRAESLAELELRSFDDSTSVTQERLRIAHSAALVSDHREEYWTLYPGGQAKEVLLQSNVIANDNGP